MAGCAKRQKGCEIEKCTSLILSSLRSVCEPGNSSPVGHMAGAAAVLGMPSKPSEPNTEGSQLKRPVGIDVGKPQTSQTNALITGSQTASNDAHGPVPAEPEEPGAMQKPQDKEGLRIPEDAVSAEQVKLDDGEEAG